MILLTSNNDIIQVTTGSTGTVKCHASYVDNLSGVITPLRTNTPVISGAVTTTIVPVPAAGTQRNVKYLSVRNDHASASNLVTVQHFDGTTTTPLWTGTLLAQEEIVYQDGVGWIYYDAAGAIRPSTKLPAIMTNASTTAQTPFATDTYLVGSNILIPTSAPLIGSRYNCRFDVTKTAAGTATPTVILRVGTSGTVSDAAIVTFTGAAQTAAVDAGFIEIDAVFRTIGSGTAATIQGTYQLRHNLAVTGLGSVNPAGFQLILVTSSGFSSAVAASIIGLSVNGGASAAWTIQLVETEFIP